MKANSIARPTMIPSTPRMAKKTVVPMYRFSLTMCQPPGTEGGPLQLQGLPVQEHQTDQQEDAVHPPQAEAERNLALVEHAARRDQQRQVGHVEHYRRQQLEVAPLAWIDARQRYSQKGYHEHQQGNGQAPLQLGAQARVF